MTSVYWTLLLLLVPLIGGAIAWWKMSTIVVWEWVAGFAVAILVCSLTFVVASKMGSADSEVFSGHAYKAGHTPKWRAEWIETVTRTHTDSKGNTYTTTHYETRSKTHHPRWWLDTTIGPISISSSLYNDITKEYGQYRQKGRRPDYDSGDKYDYFADIKDPPGAPAYPVHKVVRWDNPVVGTDTIELGREIPKEEAEKLGLFEYPKTKNKLSSARVMGGAPASTYKWDQMCAVLGPHKKVNLTLINFGDKDMSYAVKQRDYWRNGKKNDLVLCYGEGWAYVFGWSKSNLVKQELQSLMIDREVNDHIIPYIKDIVLRDFESYEWKAHSDTPRPVSKWTVVCAFILTAATQAGLYYFFHVNEFEKGRRRRRYNHRGYIYH